MEEELVIKSIQVGKQYPIYNNAFGNEGAIFEASDHQQGYLFHILYNGMTEEEALAIRFEKVNVGVIESANGFILLMFKFGNIEDMTFEIIFDPTLYNDTRALQLTDTNNLVTIVGIDSLTNIVKSLRTANLPLKMIQRCRKVWANAYIQEGYSQLFNQWIDTLQANYSVYELWNMSEKVGYLGETYNIDDIKFDK